MEALNGTITAEIYKVIAQAGNQSASKMQRFNVCFDLKHNKKPTLPETNIASENGWMVGILVSVWDGLFSGAFAVSFRECS